MKLLPLCGLAAAALSTVASAQPNGSPSVSVVGRVDRAAIRTLGPDAHGLYQLRINIADLDPATDAGWRIMQSRLQRGTAMLCDAAADGPQIAGFYDAGARSCVSQASSDGQAAMVQARDAARQGRAPASLALALR